jgi:hypothetical protein
MSFLDLYEGDQQQTAKIQPNEGTRLPSGFNENFDAAWGDGRMFGQSIARQNSRAAVLDDYLSEIKQKTGNDLNSEMQIGASGPGEGISGTFDKANARVAKLKQDYPDLDLDPLSDEEIDKRAVAKAQSAHREYEDLQSREKGAGGSTGTFLGSAASSAADPINILALGIAPETGGASVGVLGAALRWGALAGVSQAAIEASSSPFKEQVQPGYLASGQPFWEVAGATVSGAVLGGSLKALGNAWTRAKTGAWPTVVRDAGNVIESEANVASTNILPGVEGEVAHREALTKTVDDILAGNPVQVDHIISPEQAKYIEAWHGTPHDVDRFDSSKIGTGEGAQSYGHGLYFAENEAVGRDYQKLLSGKYADDADAVAHDELRRAGGDREAAASNLLDRAKSEESDIVPGVDPKMLRRAAGKLQDENWKPSEGNLYKVRITADREKMLDWDKPYSEQSQHVKDVIARLDDDPNGMANPKGSDFYFHIADKSKGMSDEAASRMLADYGIPGIKYLDQGSRAHEQAMASHAEMLQSLRDVRERVLNNTSLTAEEKAKSLADADKLIAEHQAGEPKATRNFVVFNDKDVEITHKNGKPVNADIRQDVVDQAKGLPPREPELPLQPATPETVPPEVPRKKADPNAQQPALQTPEEMAKTLTDPAHQDAIRADIDRARAMGDVKVPGIDANGKHTMVGVDAAMDEVDAYKAAAEQIQACANPMAEAAE